MKLNAYLARLPDGIASYPEMLTKGAIIRTILAEAPRPLTEAVGLPLRVQELARTPPSASSWVTEVEGWAVVLAVHEHCFAGPDGRTRFWTWGHAMNLQLFRSPLYRILFTVLSPERLWVGAARRWSAFHRGTVVSDVTCTTGVASFRLTTPPYVMPEVGRLGLTSAFHAALEIAGGKAVQVTGAVESPETSRFHATWK